MDFRTILAVLHGTSDTSRVLDTAIPLAQRFNSHLIGIHSEALPLPVATPLGFPDVEFMQMSAEDAERRGNELKVLFEARLNREGRPGEWRAMQNVTGDTALSALTVGRTVDLIIVQQADPDDSANRYPNNESLLFESGRPVLFVPYAGGVDTTFERVLVAWNGSSEAARAVFDALPFIRAAKSTEILCVDPRDDQTQDAPVSGTDIAEALARHGAKVTLSNESSAGLGAGKIIENHVSESSASLLVMGAYSHSWWRQFFFGGATSTLLQSMPVATLMSR